jgi:uncharacterized protein
VVDAGAAVTNRPLCSKEPRKWPDGVGLSYRNELSWLIHQRCQAGSLQFCEVIAENIDPDNLPAPIVQLLERGVTVVPHGVSLSLGGAVPLCTRRLDHLARVAQRLQAPFISEHIAFVRAGGVEVGHLLPVARNDEMLDIFASNYARAQAVLGVPLVLENVASLFEWPGNEMTETQFLRAALDATGAPWLLDVANLYANAANHHFDAVGALDELPLDRIAYVHLAGGVSRDGLYHDTHAHAVPDVCFTLLRELLSRTGKLPVLLERDRHFAHRAALEFELDALLDVVNRAPERCTTAQTTALTTRSSRSWATPSDHARHRVAQLQTQLAQHIVKLDAHPPWPALDARSFRAAQRALADKRMAHGH